MNVSPSHSGSGPLRLPNRFLVARLPTPIEPFERWAARCEARSGRGVDLWIKRDDLTGFALGGNKIRKLEFSFARALRSGADTVLTCGGYDSNHCRATTYLARRVGLQPELLLRTADGKAVAEPRGNTLLDQIAGAGITWVTPEEYRTGEAMLSEHAERLTRAGKRVFTIPEGASDALGALGFVAAAEELAVQEASLDRPFDVVVHAVGSGGTSAGLQAGRDALGRPWRVVGVPVCDDGAYFASRVSEIRGALTDEFHLPVEKVRGDAYLDGCAGRGYGLTTPEELRGYAELARTEGVLVDPCYTGKAFLGLTRAIESGEFPSGARILFWHTGGAFANFTNEKEWRDALAAGGP